MLRFVLNRKIEDRGAPARPYHTRGDLLLPLPPPPSWLWSPLSLSKPVGDREEQRGERDERKIEGSNTLLMCIFSDKISNKRNK
jgi:hypothetical protein